VRIRNGHLSKRPNGFDVARQVLVRLREEDRIGDEWLVATQREVGLMARVA